MADFNWNRYERIWVLSKSDFLNRYHGSVLGLFWALINPAFQLAIYYVVFAYIFQSNIENFVLFLFLGLILITFFSEASSKGLDLFMSKRYILENIPINRIDLFYASIFSAFKGFVFNFSVFILISLFSDISYTWEVIYIPLLLANLLIFVLGVMLILSVIYVHFQDVYHLWNLINMVLLWLSGIFYLIRPDENAGHHILYHLTPLPGIIMNVRKIAIYGQSIDWWIFMYDYLYALIFLALGFWVIKKFGSRAVEKL